MSRKGKKNKRQNQQNVIQQTLSTSDQQKLSTKFQNIFDKQVLSEYENDNYGECIKQCDRILAMYPKNGETLAMKGLCLHCQGTGTMKDNDDKNDDKNDDEETRLELRHDGLELIQQGLKCNLKSSICWRVKGLAHKSDKDFEAAIVCYKKASFYDKQNHRIYTDLASLQIQLKKFDEFAKTRKEIYYITGKQDKLNCIAYIISLFLNKEYSKCLEIINEELLNNNNNNDIELNNIELNEIYLLQTKIFIKQEKYEKSLTHLNSKLEKNLIVDKLSGLQLKLNILLKLNRFDDAINTILLLIDKNPENLNYHKQYINLMQLHTRNESNESNDALIFDTYVIMKQKYPKCNVIARILLSQCPESKKKEFLQLLSEYLILKFKKSVMSLYRDIQELYLCEWKALIIDELISQYRLDIDGNINGSPMCLLWVNYFYCSRLIDLYKFSDALVIINSMLVIVPTCIELYVLKARLYKYIGNCELAYKYLDYGRRLDLADRYLNTKCVRYVFRCSTNKCDIAEEIVSLFLKKTEGSLSLNNLQVMWYQLHKAEAHLSLLEYGPAIKQYENVFNHFETFWKNQTDFHRYSYRKCAINSYTQLLEWEYTLRNHPFFMRAAKNAMFLWLKIYKLQVMNEFDKLEYGSSPYNEIDKKKHRQKDERGWQLIHCKPCHSLNKIKGWLNYLLPLVENNIININIINIDIIYIYMAYMKYLLYINETKMMFEILNKMKMKMKDKYSKLLIHPYYIYNIFIFIFHDLNFHKQLLKNDNFDNYEKEFNDLYEEYNVNFLKAYYEKYMNEFDKIWCVLKCCLQIDEIYLDIGYSTNDIINQMIKLGCNPLKCVEIRKELKKYDNKLLLQTFEKYVELTYPLQLKQENDNIPR